VRACPFLIQREMERRTIGLLEDMTKAPGPNPAMTSGVFVTFGDDI
jgi:hypothetical protein